VPGQCHPVPSGCHLVPRRKGFEKSSWLNSDVQANQSLTTDELAVPGVEVVEPASAGKAFNGPWYLEEIARLRGVLREMPRRDNYVVVATGGTLFIHHKP
jgi:hypothetical protein